MGQVVEFTEFSLSVPKWDMWIGVFGGGGKRRGRVRILRTAEGDCGGGMVRRMRTLHAAHRRITDARARMPARWRIPDRLSWGSKGQLMTRGRSASCHA